MGEIDIDPLGGVRDGFKEITDYAISLAARWRWQANPGSDYRARRRTARPALTRQAQRGVVGGRPQDRRAAVLQRGIRAGRPARPISQAVQRETIRIADAGWLAEGKSVPPLPILAPKTLDPCDTTSMPRRLTERINRAIGMLILRWWRWWRARRRASDSQAGSSPRRNRP